VHGAEEQTEIIRLVMTEWWREETYQ